MSQNNVKKTCFVITPIGPDGSEIRRHIDIAIDHAIIPALGDEYEPLIPHRLYESMAITKQIYKHLDESDLVIANLTGLNPNVMYELAIRFCIGKPVIIIAEKGTALPFDVKDQRVFFYINDYLGTVELENNIKNALNSINYHQRNSSPVHDALGEIKLFSQLREKTHDNEIYETLSLIIKKLDDITERNNHEIIGRRIDVTPLKRDTINNIYKSLYNNNELMEKYKKLCDSLSNKLYEVEQEPSKRGLLDRFKDEYDDVVNSFENDKSDLKSYQVNYIQIRLNDFYNRYERMKRTLK